MTGVAAAAVVVLAIGYGIGNRNDVRPAAQTVPLAGAPPAAGSIEVFARDADGNWPLGLDVSGLPTGRAVRFELWLARDGALVGLCGSFVTSDGSANVRLTAPFRLPTYDDWVVVAAGSTERLLGSPGSRPRYRAPPA